MTRLSASAAVLVAGLLLAAAAPPPRDAGEKAADKADKMVCKKFLETGSLVKGTRVCKTKREWENDRAAMRDRASQSSNACPYAGATPGC